MRAASAICSGNQSLQSSEVETRQVMCSVRIKMKFDKALNVNGLTHSVSTPQQLIANPGFLQYKKQSLMKIQLLGCGTV